jgi:hypothetical protein
MSLCLNSFRLLKIPSQVWLKEKKDEIAELKGNGTIRHEHGRGWDVLILNVNSCRICLDTVFPI